MLFRMTNTLRVVFAGTPENAASTLESLHQSGVYIVGVLTRTDSVVGRSKVLKPSAVSEMAHKLGLEVYKANAMDEASKSWLQALQADIGVVVAYGTIFRQDSLSIPKLGWLNLHYSLLPEHRGPAPVQQAILVGSTKTGVTVFRLDSGIDTGPVVAQQTLSIDDADTTSSLLSKLTVIGSRLLIDVLGAGEVLISTAQEQHPTGEEVFASKPSRELARLDFRIDATSQFNKVRAMNPEPMAWFEYEETPVRVILSRAIMRNLFEPSVAGIFEKELVVGCRDGGLVLEVVQPAGKKEMSGADWFRGLRVEKLKLS